VNPSPEAPLLEVHDLEVRYPLHGGRRGASTLTAVAGVSFRLDQGESLGVVGESGSGKSSLARALLRLTPAAGRALFLGHDLLRLQGEALRATREHLQIIFQDPHGALDPHLRIADIVAEPLREFPPPPPARQDEAVRRMLARVGLGAELLGRYPHQLSGGQAQRVGIARALILHPRLLICDEPMAALDVSIRAQITNLLRDMRRELGLSLLYIAHDLASVRYLCERVMVLYRGRVMELAGREALFGHAQHPYTRALLAAEPIAQPLPAAPAPSAPPASTAPPAPGDAVASPAHAAGCVFHARCPLRVARCRAETPTLRAVAGHQVACHRAGEAVEAGDSRG